MKLKLLEYLKCFNCNKDFILKNEQREDNEIISGTLACSGCSYEAPIMRGIPRMLPTNQVEQNKNIAERFGYEWKLFSKFYDLYQEQFLDWIKPVEADFFKGKIILDGGCGKGRHIRLAAKFGAKEAIGIDLSEAVEVAYLETKHLPNVHIIQADLFHLPLKTAFDYIYSIGVLDHTIDPYLAFHGLTTLLKSGGKISTWVYSREGNDWIMNVVDPLRLKVTSRLPLPILKVFSYFLASIIWVVTRLVYKPLNAVPGLRNILFYRDYMVSIADFPLNELTAIVFDHLGPPSVYYLTKEEVTEWFTKDQMKEFQITWRNKNSWRASGIK